MQALLNGPAGRPPPGVTRVTPSFKNPANVDAIIISSWHCVWPFATLAILIRSYPELFLLRSVAY